MVVRLHKYLKEMFPILPRTALGYLLFFEIFFLVGLTQGYGWLPITIGDVVAGFTIMAFLLTLRIADDFKDYDTDLTLFPDRALPSGRVHKKDLAVLLIILDSITVIANIIFVGNHVFFALLVAYGFAMSFWFFQKYRIQRSLPLALITHNPVQLVLNMYVISYACSRYGIPLLTWQNILILFTLYFPGLVWEIARKVRAPQDETDYVTYSKLFGVRTPVIVILVAMFLDAVMASILGFQLYWWTPIAIMGIYGVLVLVGILFLNNPKRFALVTPVSLYIYGAQGLMVVFLIARLAGIGVS